MLAWNIRSAGRLNNARLYVINAREIKLKRQAHQNIQVPEGVETAAVEGLGGEAETLSADLAKQIKNLRTALQVESDVVFLFGAELTGSAIGSLVQFGNTLLGQSRYAALADYANSRGAADMGLLPDRLPGYASLEDKTGRKQWEENWQTSLPATPGLNILDMLQGDKLRALYVIGANPVKTFGLKKSREALPHLKLLIVHELFRTETAEIADVVLPAACSYEKEGTVTNTCGQVQRLRRALDPGGEVRTDFDILRLLSHAWGKPLHYRSPEAVFEEIRQHVPGYQISAAALLAGQAAPTAPPAGQPAVDAPSGLIFSSDDSLFTSGTLGRYSQALNIIEERKLPRSKL